METDFTPEDAAAPEAAALRETPDSAAPAEGEVPASPLAELAQRASQGRLAPADEERAIALMKEAAVGGREDVARAVENLPRLPWVIGVNAVSAVWPEMKPTMRNRLLAGLARVDSDAARRVRLSLARGLFKLEPAVAAKLAVGVAKEMRDKEDGAISLKNAQVFASVLIGRAKPWIAQLPVDGLKPAEAEALVQTALLAVFQIPHAPLTQLGVLKWAAEAGKLVKLHPATTAAIGKGLNRWNGKWQGALRREVEGLPEEILAGLKASEEPAPREGRERRESRGAEQETSADTGADADSSPASELSEDEEEDEERAREDRPAAPSGRTRPVYESKTVPARERDRDRKAAPANFHLGDTLRQIDTYVASLRAELSAAQTKLRQRDDDGRRGRKPERASAPSIPGEPNAEELARLNLQLEGRITELQQRIADLTADSEDRAASMGLATGEAVSDDAQLRTLLALKLKDDYEDFLALNGESPDVVVPKHYRVVLQHVFEVLAAEGVLTAPVAT